MISLDWEQALATGHVLAAVSAVLLGAAVYCRTWSYAGLVAAGCGQLVVAIGQGDGSWAVPVVIATVLSISGVVIFGRVPSTVDHMFAEQ
jgi:hypothetical protein